MIKHRYEVNGTSGIDEKQFIGECISDDIKKVVDMFREQKLSVHKIWRMEKVHADSEIKITKVEIISEQILKPDMRLKIEEYITELDQEIDRCVSWVEENMSGEACKMTAMKSRIEALTEVKNDLQSSLNEVI